MSDLGHSFGRFIESSFENILGCLVERLPGYKYKWRDVVGTREQIEKAILDAGINLGNSIKQQSI